jgi:hypothetical protein
MQMNMQLFRNKVANLQMGSAPQATLANPAFGPILAASDPVC